MINYAHRGASEYAPENTLSSFYLGLMQGANGIETDVQRTKDGVLVLFHDDTLTRVTGETGSVCDYTLEELKSFKVRGNAPTFFYDTIPTLREFLEAFAKYDIRFAIELKECGYEKEVLATLDEFGMKGKTTITSFKFECIEAVKKADPSWRVGWLTAAPDGEAIEQLLAIGGEEMAPAATPLNEEKVAALRAKGLGVRAWGVKNVALMKKMCELKVDGMTVNFPDRLNSYLGSQPM